MCKTSTIIWDSHFLNREHVFFPLALANLKGLPKLKTMNPSPRILSGINRVLCERLR